MQAGMINFSKIRLHKGDQRSAFEELTSQLFYSEESCDESFRRVEGSGGDGGVEAYWNPEPGEKSGFQAKYFSVLGASQWKQLTTGFTADTVEQIVEPIKISEPILLNDTGYITNYRSNTQ